MKKRQLLLFKENVDLTHGGSKLKGKRKISRPLSFKRPLHLVLKANRPFQLLRNIHLIDQVLKKYSQKFGITLHETAVQADHVHLSITIFNRDFYRRWIRAITSVLISRIAQLRWSLSPFTRIASWGRDFKRLRQYIRQNRIEGLFLLHAHERVESYRQQHLDSESFSMSYGAPP